MIATLPALSVEPLALPRALPADGDQFAMLLAAMAEAPTDGVATDMTDAAPEAESPAHAEEAAPALSPEIMALLALLAPAVSAGGGAAVRAPVRDAALPGRGAGSDAVEASAPPAAAVVDPAAAMPAAKESATLDFHLPDAVAIETAAMPQDQQVPRRRPGPSSDALEEQGPAEARSGVSRALVGEPHLGPGLRRGTPHAEGGSRGASDGAETVGREAAASRQASSDGGAEAPERTPAAPDGADAAPDGAPPAPTMTDTPRAAAPQPAPQPLPDPGHHQLAAARDAAWLDGLARDIASAAAPDGTARFAVSPERLGEVKVEISRGDDGASVRLATADERAHALLANAAPTLAAEARASGVRIAETQIDLSGGPRGQGGDPRAPAPAPILRTAAAAAPISPAPVKRHQAQDRYA